MRQGRVFAVAVLGLALGFLVTGCFTGGIAKVGPNEFLSGDLTAEATPRLARMQTPDAGDPKFRAQSTPLLPPSGPAPSLPTGTQQTSSTVAKNVRVSVRAWVNGKPIFDEEVMQVIPRQSWRDLNTLPEPQRSERLSDVFRLALDRLIDQEVAYQDAVKKLEKGNAKALEKLKDMAAQEYEKNMKAVRDSGKFTEEQIKDSERIGKRLSERELISSEYMRSRIFPTLVKFIGAEAIEDYYFAHLNEFQRVDSVKWQDVFIAVGPRLPTVAHAMRYAEDLIAQCRTNEDFQRLLLLDEGDSKLRGGEGLGTRRGEIKPAEVEDVLFRLRPGEIGPVIELSTGVHIVRVLQREFAGQIPLDVKTQNLIKGKLRSQLAEREYKRIVRELKDRSTIEIERDAP